MHGDEAELWGHLGSKLKQVGASLQELASKETVDELRQLLSLSRRMEQHPYRTLAAALGTGYVLGGGLFSPATRRLVGAGLKIGLRVAAVPLLKQQLSELLFGSNEDEQRNRSPNQEGETS
jgi:hypothetical protein